MRWAGCLQVDMLATERTVSTHDCPRTASQKIPLSLRSRSQGLVNSSWCKFLEVLALAPFSPSV